MDGERLPGQVTVHGRLAPRDVAEVETLLRAATDADGVQPLSEHVWLHLRHGGEGPDLNLLLRLPSAGDDGTLVGYAHLDPTDPVAGPSAETVVHPAYRGHGFGRLLVEAALDAAPGHRLRLWAHGDHPAARALARSMGLTEVRRLEQWRRSLRVPLPEVPLPEGVRLRTFRPGQDDQAWLGLNAAAFASHPEQGSWTLADLHARMAEAWFDPAGFLLAEEDGALIGFHWTKIHGDDRQADPRRIHGDDRQADPRRIHGDDRQADPSRVHGSTGDHDHGHEPIGEVYVVGVRPDQQGRGLGRALTVAGLKHLRDRGLGTAMLYVEGDNEPARAVYRALGFTWWDTDVMFLRSPDPQAPHR